MAKKRKKKKKDGFHFPSRDAAAEMVQAVSGMEQVSPRLLALAQKYDGDFARQEVATAGVRAAAEADMVKKLAPQMRESLFAGSPELKLASEKLMSQLGEVGPSRIEGELKRQAEEELALGGQLSADELREVQQGERAAWADRGLLSSPGASASEVLARVGAANARKAERRSFAGGVESMVNQREDADRTFTINATNQASATFDPYARLLGQGSQVTGGSSSTAQFDNALNLSSDVGRSNQQAAVTSMLARQEDRFRRDQMKQDMKIFRINRRDSLANAAANNSAARSSANASYAAAGGTALMALAMMF